MLAGALKQATGLILSADARVYETAFVSLWVSGTATVLASAVGLPVALLVALRRFPGREFALTLLNSLLALPTVVVGLFVYGLICRGSFFGTLDLLFSPAAMILGQTILAAPIVAALGTTAVISLDPAARETALVSGASPGRLMLTVAWEARYGLLAAIAAAGGRVIGEVGVSMMLGGNIAHYTRNLTTAIALETSRGEFAFALALGMILLMLALAINFSLRHLQRLTERSRERSAI